jgi:DNA-binding CsgD family transcriptional regulator
MAASGSQSAALIHLAALRERQHAAARMVAEGASDRDVAAFLGIPLSRARALLQRPAMRELIAHYRPAA